MTDAHAIAIIAVLVFFYSLRGFIWPSQRSRMPQSVRIETLFVKSNGDITDECQFSWINPACISSMTKHAWPETWKVAYTNGLHAYVKESQVSILLHILNRA